MKRSAPNPRLKDYLAVSRVQTSAVTASAPLTSALITLGTSGGEASQLGPGVLLASVFAIGVLAHIYGFALNEYSDVEIDRRSRDLSEKPLVKGIFSRKRVLVLSLSAAGLAILLAALTTSTLAVGILVSSLLLGGAYDLYGKRFAGSDALLASGMFLGALFGALAASPSAPHPLVYLVSLAAFLQVLFNNSVEGGIKDVDHDYEGGAKTLAMALGVRAVAGRLIISPRFIVYAVAVKAIHLALALFAYLYFDLTYGYGGVPIGLILVWAMTAAIFLTMAKFLRAKELRREKLLPIFSVHEIFSYSIIPAILVRVIGAMNASMLIILPVAWYAGFNTLLYGKPLQPRV